MTTGKKILTGVLTAIMAFILLVGAPMGKNGMVNAAERTLKAPSKNGDGVVTWDCVYFGNYFQSDAKGKKKEPIKWRVLSVDGNDAFLMADENLDVRAYNRNNTPVSVTWENCTLRSWLNGYGKGSNVSGEDYSSNNFLDSAFTASEQSAIKTVTVVNTDNAYYETEGGKDTQDKIFLLSYDEVLNPAYGFSSTIGSDNARRRRNTAYMMKQGFFQSSATKENGCWWLRSPGFSSKDAMYVGSSGGVSRSGEYVNRWGPGVCPVLHLKLISSDVWTYAGTVSSDGTSKGCPHENTELRGEKAALCTKTGYTGDTWCRDCKVRIKEGEAIPIKGHQWDSGVITKQATATEDSVRTFTCKACGETRTEVVPGTSFLANIPEAVQAVTDASITMQTSEDVKGAVFHALLARSTKLTGKSVTLKWKKIPEADGYKVYGNRCGRKNHYKLITDLGKNKTSYTQKKLKKGIYYKYVVAAYKVADGKKVTIGVSKTIHAATTGGKYGVAKSVKVNKSKITLKKGKKFTIKAKEIGTGRKIKRHRKIAYESDDPEVAAVSKKGVVKAKRKGRCYVYVYAQNGVYKRVEVIVK